MTDIELATHPGLDERIVILRAGDLVDAVFVRMGRFNVLFDTLDTPQACQSALDLLGRDVWDRPLIVVNSHMDWDHFWGNSAIAGRAVIVAHEKALERFRSPAVRETLRRKAQEDARFAGIALCAPTLTFPDRLRLEGGDLTLELFATPGHTPDHIAGWIPELRTCLAVDAVERPIPKVWSDDPRDLQSLVGSLRAIQALDAEHVVLAHGQTSSPAIVETNLAYFAALAERVAGTFVDFDNESLPEGLRLEDFVANAAELPPDVRRFYDRFHRANLRASLKAAATRG